MKKRTLLAFLSQHTVFVVSVVLLLSICASGVFSIYKTGQAYQTARQLKLDTAARAAHQAQWFPQTLSFLTLGRSKTLESWRLSLSLIQQAQQLQRTTTQVIATTLDSSSALAATKQLTQQWQLFDNNLQQLAVTTQQSPLLRHAPITTKITQLAQTDTELLHFMTLLTSDHYSALILLQNTDEIRASGGFIGSYARFDFSNGLLQNLKIQDIYEPAGQITTFIEAPPGAKEYLSGGKGWQLQDANWQADFPTAARDIIQLFELGKEKPIDMVLTLNVDVIEKVLGITGEVYLPDYGVSVTQDNLVSLARADRDNFFPGSKQKTNFLDSLFTQLKIKLTQLNQPQQLQLAQLFLDCLHTKNIQLYAQDAQLQTFFETSNAAGQIKKFIPTDLYFYSLESNVGINKANQFISREGKLSATGNIVTATITFSNKSDSKTGLDYINYQRLLLNPDAVIESINWGEQKITQYDEQLITTTQGQKFKQVGFLAPLAKGTQKTLKVVFKDIACIEFPCDVTLQKQAGLPTVPYTLTVGSATQTILLEHDEQLSFE